MTKPAGIEAEPLEEGGEPSEVGARSRRDDEAGARIQAAVQGAQELEPDGHGAVGAAELEAQGLQGVAGATGAEPQPPSRGREAIAAPGPPAGEGGEQVDGEAEGVLLGVGGAQRFDQGRQRTGDQGRDDRGWRPARALGCVGDDCGL